MASELNERYLHLYNLTLLKPQAINHAVPGAFTAAKAQEIALGKQWGVEIVSVESNHLVTLTTWNAFATVRSIAAYRIPGSQTDHLVVTTDSGRIAVLAVVGKEWKQVCLETYGKTGTRRIVPGHYLAADPRGRCFMIAAVEKQKFVYTLTNDGGNVVASSPLEAHKGNTVVFDLTALDTGNANPCFAALEQVHAEADVDGANGAAATAAGSAPAKQLVYYEKDVGLNHVIRKCSTTVLPTSNLLIPVPGGSDGPSGVIVCAENYVTWTHADHVGFRSIRTLIPRRQDMPYDMGLMLVSYAIHHRKGSFFFMVQSEMGDLYRITMAWNRAKGVTSIGMHYYDTVPVTSAMVILRKGFLFAACEANSHRLYSIVGLGYEDDRYLTGYMKVSYGDVTESLPLFNPNALQNLQLQETRRNLTPLTGVTALPGATAEDATNLVLTHGRGTSGTVTQMRYGYSTRQVASNALPGTITNLWTMRVSPTANHDHYLIVTFVNATVVFSIGSSLQEVKTSGVRGDAPTVAIGAVGNGGLVQVHPQGVRHCTKERVNEIKHDKKKDATLASLNHRQVAVVWGTGTMTELSYLELDNTGSRLSLRVTEAMSGITCISMPPVAEGRSAAQFIGVGFGNKAFTIFSLDVGSGRFPRRGGLDCTSVPRSAALVPMDGALQSFVGLADGSLLRVAVDEYTGELRDLRTFNCGNAPCRLIPMRGEGESYSIMALSSRTWRCGMAGEGTGTFNVVPVWIAGAAFECMSGYCSAAHPNAVVWARGEELVFTAFDSMSDQYHMESQFMKSTPKRMCRHPTMPLLFVMESENRAVTDEQKDNTKRVIAEQCGAPPPALPSERDYPPTHGANGEWCSYLRVVDADTNTTKDLMDIRQNNEAAVCLNTVRFAETGAEVYLVVGTARDLKQNPRKCSGGTLLTFRLSVGGGAVRLVLVHRTPVDGMPTAICNLHGRVAVAVNNNVRVYSLGRRRLVLKCERRGLPTLITTMQSSGDRLFVGDVAESVLFLRYDRKANSIALFADDVCNRAVTTMCVLDPNTVACGDRYGNVFVLRLPRTVTESINDEQAGAEWDRSCLNGAPQKANEVAMFHVDQAITGLAKASVAPGAPEALVYTTVLGGVGVLLPFASHAEKEQAVILERILQYETESLVGREHARFRSYYSPSSNVVDGDFCEEYLRLPVAKQKELAEMVSQDLRMKAMQTQDAGLEAMLRLHGEDMALTRDDVAQSLQVLRKRAQ